MKKILNNVQALRGISVLAVLVYHLNKHYAPFGYFGVDIFFAITGYVFHSRINRLQIDLQQNETVSSKLKIIYSFFINRFFRLVPTLGVMVAITSPLVLLLTSYRDVDKMINQAISSLLLVANIGGARYQAGDYFSNQFNTYEHLWSLSAEEQIYIIIPTVLLLTGFFARKKRSVKYYLNAILVGSLIIDLVLIHFPRILNQIGFSNWLSFMFFSSSFRIFEFYLGYRLAGRKKTTIPKHLYFALVCLLTAAFILLRNNVYLSAFTILTLSSSILNYSRTEQDRRFKLLEWFGNRSYSIYLWHLPIIFIISRNRISDVQSGWQVIFAITVTLVISELTYKCVENRWRNTPIAKVDIKTELLRAMLAFVLVPAVLLVGIRTSIGYNFFNKNLAQVKADWNLDPKCENLFSEAICGNNPQNYEKVAMLGDSHTQQDFVTFKFTALSNQKNPVEIAKSGCPWILPEERARIAEVRLNPLFKVNACMTFNEKSLKYLESTNIRKFIINQADSGAYLIDVPNNTVSQQAWISALVASAIDLQKTIENSDVSILGPNPAMRLSSPFALTNMSIFRLMKDPPRNISRREFSLESFSDNRYYVQDVSRTRIFYEDVSDWFCTISDCVYFDKNHYIYSDATHLTKIGASILIPSYERLFKEMELSSHTR